jgi:hypothetical protein
MVEAATLKAEEVVEDQAPKEDVADEKPKDDVEQEEKKTYAPLPALLDLAIRALGRRPELLLSRRYRNHVLPADLFLKIVAASPAQTMTGEKMSRLLKHIPVRRVPEILVARSVYDVDCF